MMQLCKNCRFCKDPEGEQGCRHPRAELKSGEYIDFVNGGKWYKSCDEMRRGIIGFFLGCGPQARYFEPVYPAPAKDPQIEVNNA